MITPSSSNQQSLSSLLEIDELLLNIFEFLDRSYVLDNISVCSKHLNKLCHRPYHYNRLVWKFSEEYYEKLKRIKPYFTKVQTIEMSDSDKFVESIIEEKRTNEFIKYLLDHKDTIKKLDLNFNRNQIELVKRINETARDWLQELSICIFLDTEFAKFACSQLNTFKHLKVLKLIVSNSVEADIILSACEKVLNNGTLHTFNSTILLRTENHIQRFIECTLESSLKHISFSLNCEPLVTNNELLSKLVQCLSFGRSNINIRLFNVPSIAFLNKYKSVGENCKEFNISIISMNHHASNNNEDLELSNVYEFSIDSGNISPKTNHFPMQVRNLKLQLNSRIFPNIDDAFIARCNNLVRLELHSCNVSIEPQLLRPLPFFEHVHFEKCEVTSVGSIFSLSTKLKIFKCIESTFHNETREIPLQIGNNMRELTIKDCRGAHCYLTSFKDLKLESLTCAFDASDDVNLNIIEEMTSLEYLSITNVNSKYMLSNLRFDKLTNLKYFIHNALFHEYDRKNFSNLTSILSNTFIILGYTTLYRDYFALNSNYNERPKITNEEIDRKIINAVPTMQKEISKNNGYVHYYLFDEKFVYVIFSIQKHHVGFILLENEAPYKVIAHKLSNITIDNIYTISVPRRISMPSKCLIN